MKFRINRGKVEDTQLEITITNDLFVQVGKRKFIICGFVLGE